MTKTYTITVNGQKHKIICREASLRIKAVKEEGIVEGYASVFGNVDSYQEIVDKGAFEEWLKDFSPRYPKFIQHHDWNSPIGKILEVKEDAKGLYFKAQLLLELDKAKEMYVLLKEGVITDVSFGFSVMEDYFDESGLRHLKKLAIWEISPVLVGANRDATVDNVKSQKDNEEVEEEPEEKPQEEEDDKPEEEVEKDKVDEPEPEEEEAVEEEETDDEKKKSISKTLTQTLAELRRLSTVVEEALHTVGEQSSPEQVRPSKADTRFIRLVARDAREADTAINRLLRNVKKAKR